MRNSSWRAVRGGWRHLVAIPVIALLLLPFALLVTTSLRQTGRPLSRDIEWIPRPAAWENYPAVFDLLDFWRYAANSFIVVVAAVPLTVLVASWAGFSMAQLPRAWRLRLTAVSFIVMMVPFTAIWLTRFLLYKEAGLIDSRLALIIPAFGGTSPFYVLLFLWTFLRIPPDLTEAARLEGASAIRVWAGIAMPLARPTIVAVAVLSFVHYWGSFIDPLIYIRSTDKMTLPYALQLLQQLDRTNWPLLMAGAVMVTLPAIVAFLLVQRAFLQPFRDAGWHGR